MDQPKKPSGFENYLSEYTTGLFDGNCSEPVALGLKIITYLGEDLFRELGKYARLSCIDGFKSSCALVTKTLNRKEAIEKYGPVTNAVLGATRGLEIYYFW
jgi:hypothetical protein